MQDEAELDPSEQEALEDLIEELDNKAIDKSLCKICNNFICTCDEDFENNRQDRFAPRLSFENIPPGYDNEGNHL